MTKAKQNDNIDWSVIGIEIIFGASQNFEKWSKLKSIPSVTAE